MQSGTPIPVKMVVVGDGCVGKTCILFSYAQDRFPHQYVPTVFDNYSATIKVDSRVVSLGLWDTAGQEEYARLRTLAYMNSDIFLIVFDVNEPSSFTNALKKWYPELSESNPKVPKLFVGSKIDLRVDADVESGKSKAITKATASKVIKEMGCTYMECSALTQEGLKDVFIHGIQKVLDLKLGKTKKEEKSSFCSLI